MSAQGGRDRRGASSGDALLFIATLSIAAALLYPALSVRGFRAQVATAIADVDALSAAARGVRDDTNRWPTPAPPGEAPPELSGLRGDDDPFRGAGYVVEWTPWAVVDSVEAPPTTDVAAADDAPQEGAPPEMLPFVREIGAVGVHSGNATLLAELLEHYPQGTSFVVDTTWLLILPERGEPAGGG